MGGRTHTGAERVPPRPQGPHARRSPGPAAQGTGNWGSTEAGFWRPKVRSTGTEWVVKSPSRSCWLARAEMRPGGVAAADGGEAVVCGHPADTDEESNGWVEPLLTRVR